MLLGLLHGRHLRRLTALFPASHPTDAQSGLRSAGKGSCTSGASCVVYVIIQETFPHFLTKEDVSLGFPQTFFIG